MIFTHTLSMISKLDATEDQVQGKNQSLNMQFILY